MGDRVALTSDTLSSPSAGLGLGCQFYAVGLSVKRVVRTVVLAGYRKTEQFKDGWPDLDPSFVLLRPAQFLPPLAICRPQSR